MGSHASDWQAADDAMAPFVPPALIIEQFDPGINFQGLLLLAPDWSGNASAPIINVLALRAITARCRSFVIDVET